MREKIQRKESKVAMLDYAMKNPETEDNKYIYKRDREKPSITNQTMNDFMSKKDSAIDKALDK